MSKAGSSKKKSRITEVFVIVALIACGVFFFRQNHQEEKKEAQPQSSAASISAEDIAETTSSIAKAIPSLLVETVRNTTPTELRRDDQALVRIQLTSKFLEKDPKDVRTRLRRIGAYRRLEMNAEALEDLNFLLEMNPDDTQLLHHRSFVLHKLGRKEDAIADLERALESGTEVPVMAFNNLAYYKAELGHYEEALPWAEKAVQGLPENGGVWDTLGYVYVGLGQHQKAIEAYEKAIKYEPLNAHSLRGIAVASRALGLEEQSNEALKNQRTIDPDFCLHWEGTDVDMHHPDKKHVLISPLGSR